MSEISNESIRSASFVTARSHISASNPHSSYRPPVFGSATQIQPRVVAYEATLALEEEREAARLAAVSAAKAPTTKEIATLFTAALQGVRDAQGAHHARMIVASTRFPKDANQNSSIIPLSYKAKHRVTFGVVQQAQDVDLVLRLPLKGEDANPEFDTGITCQIIYDPGRDHCLLVNVSEPPLRLTNFSSSPPVRVCIRRNKSRLIQPGMWRISIDDDGDESREYHLAEFWLLGRQFNVSIHKAKHSWRTKRGIDDSAEENVNKRRKLNSDLTGTTSIQPINKTAIEPRPAAIVTKRAKAHDLSPSLSTQKVSCKAVVPLLDLEDGDQAIISAPGNSTDKSQSLSGAKGPASYELRRVEQKGATPSASVFACKHSRVSGPVVAKVLQYKRDEPYKVQMSLSIWKTEKETLEKLKHRNIVSLKAFDGRMLAIYLEPLPKSLDRGKKIKFSQLDIFTVLLNISSALVYLKTIPIIHNDIKPSNITYSPERGAVLIDFGMATSTNTWKAGGTSKYIPPDLLVKSRGSQGDIWALGITMLYLFGKIQYPETSGRNWNIHDLSCDENYHRMINWLKHVQKARATLSPVNAGTVSSKLESIVFKMLESDSKLRFDAENIISALGSSTTF
ncbi:hypothetical protein MKX08_001383 [Trichoderma sp. CBMAI-0020]|nr:hypothetical protein MKX08_001383 [Trichoderma sp. CBMAI-0020]